MCGISQRNASPAPAPRFSEYTSAPLSGYSPMVYSNDTIPAESRSPVISVTYSPTPSRSGSPSPISAHFQTNYVSSRGTGYYQGIEYSSSCSHQTTPQLVYSSVSSIRSESSRRSSSVYSSRDSPRGSWYGDELSLRPSSRQSRGSFCSSPDDEGQWTVWKAGVRDRSAERKERRGAVNGALSPVDVGLGVRF